MNVTRQIRPGDWYAVLGPSLTVAVPRAAKEFVPGLWEAVESTGSLEAVLDVLLSVGVADLPGFVVLEHGPSTRVLVRGGAQVVLRGEEEHTISAARGHLWVETHVEGVVGGAVRLGEESGDVVALTAGVVPAGLVEFGEPATPGPEADPASVGADAPATDAPDTDAPDTDTPDTDTLAAEAPAADAAVEEPEAVQPAAVQPDDAESDAGASEAEPGTDEPVEVAAEEEANAEQAVEEPEAAEAPAPPPDEVVDAAPETDTAEEPPAPEEPVVPSGPVPPPAPPSGPVPPPAPPSGWGPPTSPPFQPAAPVPPAAPATPVFGVTGPPPGYEFPPSDAEDTVIGVGAVEDQAEPAQPPAPSVLANPVATLVFSTGDVASVDRVILVGRAPEARRFASEDMPQLISVQSPNQEISSTHLEIRPGSGVDHGMAVVTDLGSTNGTVLVQPGLPPEELQPGIAIALIPGAILDLGDGVTIQTTNP